MSYSIESQIEINASPAKVWACLLDFKQYPLWNPLIPLIEGTLAKGSALSVRITPPGLGPNKYTLTITRLDTEKEFAWLGHLGFPGLMDGDHSFIIKPLSAEKVLFIQLEIFSGVLIPFLKPFLRKNMQEGFDLMNAALKKRVETNS